MHYPILFYYSLLANVVDFNAMDIFSMSRKNKEGRGDSMRGTLLMFQYSLKECKQKLQTRKWRLDDKSISTEDDGSVKRIQQDRIL